MGEATPAEALKTAYRHLAELARRSERRWLLAQNCSRVAWNLPLFSALMNYRHARRRELRRKFDGTGLIEGGTDRG